MPIEILKIGVIIISISENKCCNHDTIAKKTAIVGAWHHPDLISRGSEDSKTVLTSNTCFFSRGSRGIPPAYS